MTASGTVSHMILRLEQQQVGIRPPPYHRLPTASKLSRCISQPAASRPQVFTVTDNSNLHVQPATRHQKSGGAGRVTRQTSAIERLARDFNDDVTVTSPLRQAARETFSEVL